MAEGSLLLLEEFFASGDPRFLTELVNLHAPKKLGAFAERWLKDPRPWARVAMRTWLEGALEIPDHKPLVKRLFKLAEAAGDDGAMALFLWALDRGVRREAPYAAWNPDWLKVAWPPRGDGQAFTVHTRHYLRRRAWRTFRRLGYRDPARYVAAVMQALPLYRDRDVDSGVHLLDNWGLMHALFHHSDVVFNKTNGWRVRAGKALRELKPAPAFPKAWDARPEAIFELLSLAQCRPVRRTAHAMLKARPELLQKVPFDLVLRLLEHEDEEVQSLGVDLLGSAAGLESVPLEVWTRLLEQKSLAVLEAVCGILARIVSPDRFAAAQLLAFACAPLGPVAKLGLDWLRTREVAAAQLVELAHVRAPSAAADAVALARERMSASPDFDPEWLLAFLDSTLLETRRAAWAWFGEEKRARHRLDLWAKLVESPYDDVRMGIVRHLEQFAAIDTALRVLLARAPLETVWATVLLNIHRGNRAKRMAASQIADAIERDPARAPQLIPLLAIAARSVRAPEFRAGLASLVRVAVRRPEVAAAVGRHFPEIRLAD